MPAGETSHRTGDDPISGFERQAKPRTLIILMPWAVPDFPGLGPTTIRTVVEKAGLPCDILYGNLIFSRLNGGDPFVEKQLAKLAISEIAFTPYYFNADKDECAGYFREYASAISDSPIMRNADRFRRIIDAAGACLDEIMAGIDWDAYDIVGFSVMMQQTVSSLALARRIKARKPSMHIIFGGPSVSFPMGDEMIRAFPEIDVIIEGEGEGVIVPVIEWMRDGGSVPAIPGIIYRDGDSEIRCTGRGGAYNRIGELPIPDFDAFFEQLAANELGHVEPYLSIETSRGCWWGQKHHCTFCGIDDVLMQYRSKGDQQVVEEIVTLAHRHKRTEFFVVDSIINHRFFKTVLPALAELRDDEEMDFTFFFESKSNLTREKVRQMRAAGVNLIQPGVESFSDRVLKLMDKGTTGIRQLQCLKLLAEQDIGINWNLILGNPGERVEDYEQMLEMIPFMHHLPPTHDEGVIPMQINRFAPYHERPEVYGIESIRPKPYMGRVFPDPNIDLLRLSFYFDYDHEWMADPRLKEIHGKLRAAVDEWTEVYAADALVQRRGPGFIRIEDRRASGAGGRASGSSAAKVTVLRQPWSDILAYCDEVRSEAQVVEVFGESLEPDRTRAFIDTMVDDRLMYRSPSKDVIGLPLLRAAERD